MAMADKHAQAFQKITGGGLIPGVLTQVYGPPASGKTNLALIATVECARHGRVIYIDPEGGFSTQRLKQITGGKIQEALENILLVEPTTFQEQKKALEKLDDLVPNKNTQLVVLDSVALLYRVLEEKDIKEYGRMLAQLLRIARKHEVRVMLTNQVYTNTDTNRITPVGGDQINSYWSKVIIELGFEGNQRFAKIRKHQHEKSDETIRFKIVDEGFELE
ncbi:MAG TPA: DNA repair and recombination protein RadB [Candidatus Altiarchaeales archaeon]|nr:DNA repair and recombination protein RadB [Candidatus Altiarchaeales archaeon]